MKLKHDYFFDELWILTKDGIPIIEITELEHTKQLILGGFYSALQSFCRTMSGEEIKSILMGDIKFICKSIFQGEIILTIKCTKKIKEKTINKFLNVIGGIFENLYELNDILEWQGDAHFFSTFRDALSNYLQLSNL